MPAALKIASQRADPALWAGLQAEQVEQKGGEGQVGCSPSDQPPYRGGAAWSGSKNGELRMRCAVKEFFAILAPERVRAWQR